MITIIRNCSVMSYQCNTEDDFGCIENIVKRLGLGTGIGDWDWGLELGSREWGLGNGEWGMEKWNMGNREYPYSQSQEMTVKCPGPPTTTTP